MTPDSSRRCQIKVAEMSDQSAPLQLRIRVLSDSAVVVKVECTEQLWGRPDGALRMQIFSDLQRLEEQRGSATRERL